MSRFRVILIVPILFLSCIQSADLRSVTPQQNKKIISWLHDLRKGISSIHIRMRAAVYGHGRARKGRMEVFARGEDLRAEVWSPTDNLLDLVVVCGDHFMHLDPGHKVCEQGMTSTLQGLPFDLPQKNIPAILAGLGPDPGLGKVFKAGDTFVVKSGSNGTNRTIRLAVGPMRVISYEIRNGKRFFHVEHSRFHRYGDMQVPGRVRITTKDGITLLKYKTVRLNIPMGKDVFDCSCPAGFQHRGKNVE